MKDKEYHHHFFTEENSPVPLVPADEAWEAMHARLEQEQPARKRRRMIAWLPPVGCVALILLLLGGGYGIWRYADSKTTTIAATQQPSATSKRGNAGVEVNSDTLHRSETKKEATTDKGPSLVLNNEQQQAKALQSDTTGQILPAVAPPQQAITGGKHFNLPVRGVGNKERENHTTIKSLPETASIINFHPSPITASENDLRLSLVPGVHFNGRIQVVPARAPQPVWLPEDHPTDVSSGNKPARQAVWAMGVQAEVPVPVSAIDVYFKDPKVRERFYQPIIPGIWGSVSKNRHRVMVEIKPFASALLPNKPFETIRFTVPGTTLTATRQLTMLKVFGMQSGVSYNYQIRKHWWVGAGLTASIWNKALIHENYWDDSLLNKTSLYGVSRHEAPYLRTIQPGASLQLGYSKNAVEGILQLESPFTTTAKGGPVPTWVRLGIRLRLLQRMASVTTPPANRQAAP